MGTGSVRVGHEAAAGRAGAIGGPRATGDSAA